MTLLIRGATVVNADSRQVADVLCEATRVTQVAPEILPPPGATVIDGGGRYLFPGFIDPHTHIYLPFMGTHAKDDYTTATRAAVAGGTTTLFEMCCPDSRTPTIEGYRTWRAQAEGRALCDYSFHMGVTRFDADTPDQLREIVADGVTSFKVFLAYAGALGIEDRALYETLVLARKLGVLTTAHCENAGLIAARQAELLAEGRTGPEAHAASRPPRVEATGVHQLCAFAELAGAPVYIVHLSCREALEEALQARQRGVTVQIETLIQYLLLDGQEAERPNFEGAKYVMSPPLRSQEDQATLWDALARGVIQTVATDHAPFDFATQKILGRDDFTRIPNGIPGIEDRVKLLYTHGVAAGRLELETFVDVASTKAARLFGLYPRKGVIQPGADADLVLWDPAWKGVIRAADQEQAVDYNAYEGWEIIGRPELVTVRGRIVARDGRVLGEPGWGAFLRRLPV